MTRPVEESASIPAGLSQKCWECGALAVFDSVFGWLHADAGDGRSFNHDAAPAPSSPVATAQTLGDAAWAYERRHEGHAVPKPRHAFVEGARWQAAQITSGSSPVADSRPTDERCTKVMGTGTPWVCNKPSYDYIHQDVADARPGSGKHVFKPAPAPASLHEVPAAQVFGEAYEAFWADWRATHDPYQSPAAYPSFFAGYNAGRGPLLERIAALEAHARNQDHVIADLTARAVAAEAALEGSTALGYRDGYRAAEARLADAVEALTWIAHFDDAYLASLATGATTLHIDMAQKARAALSAAPPSPAGTHEDVK